MKFSLGLAGLLLAVGCAHRKPLPESSALWWSRQLNSESVGHVENQGTRKLSSVQNDPRVWSYGPLTLEKWSWDPNSTQEKIEGWERSFESAPWWRDPLLLSIEAQLLAQFQGLREYSADRCWTAYASAVQALALGTEIPTPAPIAAPPATHWFSPVDLNGAGSPLAEEAVWNQASPDFHPSWKDAFQQGLEASEEIEELRENAAAHLWRARLRSGTWIDFIELTSDCSQYILAARAFRQESKCLKIGTRYFGVKRWPPQRQHFDPAQLRQSEDLSRHISWTCAVLGGQHARQLPREQARRLAWIFAENPVVTRRLQQLTEEEGRRALEEYRKSLKENKDTDKNSKSDF